MICYLIFSVLIAAAAFTVRRRSLLRRAGGRLERIVIVVAEKCVAALCFRRVGCGKLTDQGRSRTRS